MKKIIFKKALVLSSICFLVFTYSCSKNSDDEKDTIVDNFDRKALFENIGNNIVLPSFLNMVTASDSLVASAIRFQKNGSQLKLDDIRNKWQKAILFAKELELMKFGPLNNNLLYSSIHKWPIKTSFIDGFINGTDSISINYVDTKGATSKGLGGIEYLLFNPSVDLVNNPRAQYYLTSCCSNFQKTAIEAASLWSPLGDNFIDSYTNNLQNGLSGSLSITVNQMSSLLEFMYVTKLGKPLGKELNSGVDPSKLEAWRSNFSIDLLLRNTQIFKNLFNGESNSRIGFDDYLNDLNVMHNGDYLSNVINEKTDRVIAILENTSSPLNEILSSPSIEEVYSLLKEITVLIKADMASALSITITFSDNDGD